MKKWPLFIVKMRKITNCKTKTMKNIDKRTRKLIKKRPFLIAKMRIIIKNNTKNMKNMKKISGK